MPSSLQVSCSRPVADLSPSPGDWHWHAVHSTDEMGPILDAVMARMEAGDYPRRDVLGVRLALEEAILNALKHGNGDDTNRSVWARFHVSAGQVLLEVQDEGPGFEPAQVPDPLAPENRERPTGRGLLLMRHYMTWIEYNPRGNRVTLCKRRSAG